MSRVGVIVNPGSGRGRGKGLALAELLKTKPTSNRDVVVLNKFPEIYPALEQFAAQGVTELFISSGDGTVQAIQTWLAESKAFANLPRLCLLPHGTTNMTAADLGFKRRNIAEQADFICTPTPQETTERHTVRAANPAHGKPQQGMFFGTGAVSEATRYCQTAFNDKGVGGNWATFATLATVLSKSLFLKPNPHDPNRFDRPYPITVKIQDQTLCQGDQLMMLATTLNKLILGAKPFWGGSAGGPLRVTTMPYPVPSIPRWIISSLYGSETRKFPPGALSRSCGACDVTTATSFVIDGEFHDAPKDQPLRLETGALFRYITA
jgi:diacylglycerol kinase (ATP)